jgi:protein involved in polysaccharide export with SLBB domain
MLIFALAAAGCTTKSSARMKAQNAFLAGQHTALQQQAQAAAQGTGVTIIGAVQNPQVPWVEGLTLAQAIATANYLDSKEPEEIILTRQGESATLPPNILLSGAVVPLKPGDVVEIH